MQLGLSSYACAWAIGVPGYRASSRMDAAGLVRHAAGLGVSLVQIADNLPLEQSPSTELQTIRDTARALGVALEIGTRGIAGAHIGRMLDLCEFFGSSLLRVVVDTTVHQPDPDEIVATVKGLLPALDEARVTLAIENHDRLPSQVLASIMERIGSPRVGVCLDTVNSFGTAEGPEHVLACLAPFTANLHVKDFAIRRAFHNMGFEISGTPAGAGALPIPWLIDRLRSVGRDPNAILELWVPPEPSPDESIRREAEWQLSSIRYLRTLIPPV